MDAPQLAGHTYGHTPHNYLVSSQSVCPIRFRVHVLCNLYDVPIIVFQEKERDNFNCGLNAVLFEPGWKAQRQLTRPDVKWQLAKGAVPIHAMRANTHFSGILPQLVRAVDLDVLPEHFTARDMRIAGRANPKSRIAHVID